jgi:outer membrane protein, heavy metal efflux system
VRIVADQFEAGKWRLHAIEQRRLCEFGTWRHIIVLALVGACASCVDYQAAPLKPEQTAEQFSARRLDAPQLQEEVGRLIPQAATAWPPQPWNRAELLAVALVQNPQLVVARAQVQATLAHEITAAQAPNPDLTLQSEYARHDVHPWLYGLNLNWLLRTASRQQLESQIARLDTGNASLQLMDQTWAVRRALAAALSDRESAHRRLGLLDRLAADQDRLVALERERIAAGEDAPSALVTGQQARIEIGQQRAELRMVVEASQSAAAKALGLPPQALDGLVFDWPDWGEPPAIDEDQLRETREQALLSRADLGVAIGDYAMAEARLQQAVARQYPQLEFQPGYYWDHGIAKFPFDVSFSLPFNRNKGEIAEARAGRELAAQHMLALQADIYGQIAAAERAERIARASKDLAERQLQTARTQKQQADLGLRLGASTVQEQVAAEVVATRAELEVVQMRAQVQTARNVLEDALHTPLSGPELALARSISTVASGAGS